MTTKHSPLSALKAQADKIAATLKAAECGEIDARFAESIRAARARESFEIGIVMDDKIIAIKLRWAMVRTTSESGIAEYILKQMRETRGPLQ